MWENLGMSRVSVDGGPVCLTLGGSIRKLIHCNDTPVPLASTQLLSFKKLMFFSPSLFGSDLGKE